MKRQNEDGGSLSPSKRVKVEGDDLAVQKAAKFAALKARIQANMSKVRSIETTSSAQPSAPAQAASQPAERSIIPNRTKALLLDQFGRHIDERGNLIVFDKTMTATTLANKRRLQQEISEKTKVEDTGPTPEETMEGKNYRDPRMRVPSSNRKARTSFNFVRPGTYVRRAENMRDRAVMKELGLDAKLAAEVAEEEQALGEGGEINPNMIQLDRVQPKREAPVVESVEWWDARVLPKATKGSYEENAGPWPSTEGDKQAAVVVDVKKEEPAGDEGDRAQAMDTTEDGAQVKTDKEEDKSLLQGWRGYKPNLGEDVQRFALKAGGITHYIEHPVPVVPARLKKPAKMLPVMLTKKEMKKMRRKSRAEREKEKQDMIRLGLMDAPAPKVKLSNMMRVKGQEAIQDPTKNEAEVRKQMAARQAKHEEENEKRKLTEEERKRKKHRKMFGGDKNEILVNLYKIEKLDNKQHRFKIDINAKQNELNGIAAIFPQFSIVVVEGGAKSIARYRKLMLRRIQWTEQATPREGDEVPEVESDSEADYSNTCQLVWEGKVMKPNFQSFKFHNFNSGVIARGYFEKKHVPQYFDMCKNYKLKSSEF